MPNELDRYDYADPRNPLAAGMDPETGMTARDWAPIRQGLTDWVQAQRQKSYDMGLADPNTGLPTQAGLNRIGSLYAGAMVSGTGAPKGAGVRAFHGSPHDFERFDINKIGTGEGAQAYGRGLYFAEKEDVAQSYKGAGQPYYLGADRVTAAQALLNEAGGDRRAALQMAHDRMSATPKYSEGKLWQDVVNNFDDLVTRTPGKMYEVALKADPEQMLHLDKPLSEQSHILEKLPEDVRQQLGIRRPWDWADPGAAPKLDEHATGRSLLTQLERQLGDPAAAATTLREAGIPGLRYLDQGSRAEGQGSHNYVMFDPDTIDILRKYGIAGLGIGAGANALDRQD